MVCVAVISETTLLQALAAAESFRNSICAAPFETSAGALTVTVSIGIAATVGSEPLTSTDLIAAADDRLYQAKRTGRNCVAS